MLEVLGVCKKRWLFKQLFNPTLKHELFAKISNDCNHLSRNYKITEDGSLDASTVVCKRLLLLVLNQVSALKTFVSA